MTQKPTYEELEQKIKEAEKKAFGAKQTIEAFAWKNAALNSFLNNISDMAWVKDTDSRFIAVNKAFCEVVGMGMESLINHTCEVCFTREKAEKFREDDLKVMEDRKQNIIEEKIIDSEKNEVWLETAKSPMLDESGKVIGTVGMARDISKRRQTEVELAYKTALLEAQSQTSIDGILVIDSEGKVVMSNERMREMWNIPQEIWESGEDEVLLRHAITLLKYPDEFLEKVRYLYVHKNEKSRNEIALKDGRYFDRYSSPLIDSTNKYHGRIWFFRDITKRKKAELALEKLNLELEERVEQRTVEISKAYALLKRKMDELKQTEEALRESEEKYRLIMASMKDAVYIVSNEFRIEYMNPRMIDKIGRNAVGELCYKAVYDNDAKCSWCVFNQILQGKCVEYELANPGDNRYYSISNSPVHHGDGNISKLTIFHDITEQKAIESQLRKAQKMEAIGTLAGGIAHEFNNILGIILGNTELAIDDVPEWNPAKNSLKEIHAASLRAKGVVRQILSFAQKTPFSRKPIKISSIIKESLKLIRATIPTSIEIHHEILCDSEMIFATTTEINQILINLCSNSAQAMEEETGILAIRLETIHLNDRSAAQYEDLAVGAYVKLTVKDNGKGIDPAIINQIFDPYFTTKNVDKGLGMGLAVVYGLVKKHDGAIKYMSKVGKGTTVEVLFPIIEGQTEIEMEKSDHLPTGTECILFVDDEEAIVDITQKLLERLGYRVETKINPVEALELFQLKPSRFDLVITDMTMPQMTGVTLSKKLMDIRPGIPVIICTGHSSLINEEKAEEQGIAAYVTKPTTMSDIAKIIRKVLDEAKRSTHE